MSELLEPRAIGADLRRLDGWAKVTGTAPYASEHPVDQPTYLHAVQSSIVRGRIVSIDTAAAETLDGVLFVLSHKNAPPLGSTEDQELSVFQSDEVAFRGQFVAAVVAETPEIARHAAGLVQVTYDEWPHDVEFSASRDDLYEPESASLMNEGDVDEALSSASITVDATYTTPTEHNNPMEPHATTAIWRDDSLTMYDSTQGAHTMRSVIAPVFGLDPEQIDVFATYVGGGFGSKGTAHAHNILAGLAAQLTDGRPVKFALTRQQMFSLVGYRPPTIQRIRLGADANGRLSAIAHDSVEQTAKIKEFLEQSTAPTRTMYASPNRRTTQRLAALDVSVPFWMRAPGEAPGMFALEVAMDELAHASGLDPIEIRARNEPDIDPETGFPYSGRKLITCLREGASRFGWERRNPVPGSWRENDWLVGFGVASSTYPASSMPGSIARVRAEIDGRYTVSIGAADIGTGTFTALTQIAADALNVPTESIDLQIGATAQPAATVAGGSTGISSWGSAIAEAARKFREEHGPDPPLGAEMESGAAKNPEAEKYATHSFGAQFAEVRVHADTGEVRVPRMLGIFSVGRVINPLMARSQFIGGMTMGLSMALHEESVLDERFGHIVNADFAEYHIATSADVGEVGVDWLDEHDPYINPMGARGIGEIGIVGSPAAIVNAVYNATGIRVRNLPITLGKLLSDG